ncbi:glycosyltransferase family 2 protein [uncultured Pseudokineococcus sp.]|uniref:glycosyltransferase family 2 protein n=1 Tax=uncultured Pseudokineococcus sp. TaxID=1642928 RepID=UPI002607D8C1|nr:glycosyltransferase family 2 protein [uncultured Pseudokineococcus sp.]
MPRPTPFRPDGGVLVVVPAYNEAAALPATLAEISSCAPGVDVLVVDDGSTDDTRLVARGRGVPVLVLPFNLGVGGAVRAGYRYALRCGYGAVVQVDADGQHDPADVERLVAGLAEANVVVGARFADRGTFETSRARRLAMTLLARTISTIARHRLTDTTSGFKAVDRKALAFYAANFPAEYLGDTVEALVMGARAGLVIRQVPVEMRQRRAGTPSQRSWKAGLYLGRAVVALFMALIRRQPALETAS